MIKLPRFLRRDPLEEPARRLYITVVEQARQPAFYVDFGVPDTVEGRFDMVAMHAFLVLRRLRRAEAAADGGDPGQPGAAQDLAQSLFDLMFNDMETNLRELGVGDMGIGRRVRKLAEAFYGRIAAYGSALDAGGAEGRAALEQALDRNLYQKVEVAPDTLATMAAYVEREAEGLDAQPLAALQDGAVRFGAPPHPQHTRGPDE